MENDFEELSPYELAAFKEKLTPAQKHLADSHYGQESNSGKNAGVSSAGAIGGMQMLPDTFNRFADKGWDINNAEHNARAGMRFIKHNLEKAGGDVALAAKMYYAGDHRLDALKAGANYPAKGGPDSNTYGQQILDRYNSFLDNDFEPVKDLGNMASAVKQQAHDQMTHLAPKLEKDSAVDFANQDPENYINRLARYRKADARPLGTKLMAALADESLKLGQGGADILDTGLSMIAPAKPWFPALNEAIGFTKEAPILRQQNRAKYEAMRDNASLYDRATEGFTGTVGRMIPYLGLNEVFNPIATKGVSALTNVVLPSIESAAAATGRGLATGVTKVGGQPAKDAFVTPIKNWSDAVKKGKVDVPDKDLAGTFTNPLTYATVGGMEGALHYDNTVKGGAVTGLVGGLAGNTLNKFLANKPSFWQGTDKDLIRWYEDAGARKIISPAQKLGSRSLATYERDLQNSEPLLDYTAGILKKRHVLDNRIVAKAIGIDSPYSIDKLDGKTVSDHLANLGRKYDALEAGTVVHVPTTNIAKLRADNDALITSPFKEANDAGVTASHVIETIDNLAKSDTLSGNEFKVLRSDLRDSINKAYANGDSFTIKALKPIMKELDDGIARGVLNKNGRVGLKEWKDVNEKYATTSLILKHGLNADGNANPAKISRHFVAAQSKSFMSDKGSSSMKDLYKLAKVHELFDSLKNPGFTKDLDLGEKITAPSLAKRALTGAKGNAGYFTKQLVKRYYSKWPGTTGLLNMSRSRAESLANSRPGSGYVGGSFWTPSTYANAYGQTQQLYPHIYSAAERGYNASTDAYEKLRQKLEDYLK